MSICQCQMCHIVKRVFTVNIERVNVNINLVFFFHLMQLRDAQWAILTSPHHQPFWICVFGFSNWNEKNKVSHQYVKRRNFVTIHKINIKLDIYIYQVLLVKLFNIFKVFSKNLYLWIYLISYIENGLWKMFNFP